MRIDSPKTEKHGGLWLAFLIGLAMGIPAYLYFARPAAPVFYEMGNFLGKPEVYSSEKEAWVPAERGGLLAAGDRVRTGPKDEIDLKVSGKMSLRVKGDSELQALKSKLAINKDNYEFHLSKGSILGATGKEFTGGAKIRVSTPVCVAAVRGTLFRIVHNSVDQKTWVGVLQGTMNVSNKEFLGQRTLRLKNLQTAEITESNIPEKPKPISQKDWEEIKESYELIERSAGYEAIQQDLSKEAGSLFGYIFDHGTFYMPKFGYADREFVRDPLTEIVHLNVEYDVFPRGSFVGVYFKTREFDISKFEKLTVGVRRAPGRDFPEAFRVEFKSKSQVVRAFSPKVFKKEWRPLDLEITATKPLLVDEITFVFAHDKVGEHKKGVVQFRDFNLVEKESEEEPEPQSAPVPDRPSE